MSMRYFMITYAYLILCSYVLSVISLQDRSNQDPDFGVNVVST